MNAAHFHLIVVHIPIVLAPLGALLLLVALWKKNNTLIITSSAVSIVATLFCIAANLSGEEAEDIVEKLPYVVEQTIEDHEEAAEVVLWPAVILGVTSLITILLTLTNRSGFIMSSYVTLIMGVLTSALLGYVGYEGGKIRHPEAYSSPEVTQDSRVNDHD